MSVLFADGLDDMRDAEQDMEKVFFDWSKGGSDSSHINPGDGRFGGSANRLGTSGSGFSLLLADPSQTADQFTGVVSFAFYTGDVPDQTRILHQAQDLTFNRKWQIDQNTNGTMSLFAADGTPLGTSGVVVSSGTWHFMEIKWDVPAGALIVRLDQSASGATDLFNVSGVDLDDPLEQVAFQRWDGAPGDARIDDLIVMDLDGPINNDFLGDGRIIHLRPEADAAPNQFTPSSGVDHFAMVDQGLTVNPDTTSLEATALNLVERFGYEDLPAGAEAIDFAVLNTRSDDAGTGTDMASQIVSSAVLVEQEDAVGLNIEYQKFIRETDPATSLPWTRAAVNAVLAGFKSL